MTNRAVCNTRVVKQLGAGRYYLMVTAIKYVVYLDSEHLTVLVYKQLRVWVIN